MLMLAVGLVFKTTACFADPPSVSVDARGLGDSVIGHIVRERWMVTPEKAIAQGILEAIYRGKQSNVGLQISELADLGFHCPMLPSKECVYEGRLIRRLHGLPAGATIAAVTAVDVRVTVALSSKPARLDVKVTETTINSR